MLRRAARLGALVALCVAAWPLRASPVPGIRQVIVTPLDASDAVVKGLTAADFQVFTDGASGEITKVEPPADPLVISLLIDTAKPAIVANFPMKELRAGLAAFVTTVQTANPSSTIAYTDIAGAAVQVVNFTAKTPDLLKAINRLIVNQRASSVLMEAMVDTSKDLMKKPSQRKAIVSVTFDDPEASSTPPNDVIIGVTKCGAAFWAIAIDDSSNRTTIFERLPASTGGMRMTGITGTAVEGLLKKLAEALTNQYLLTYTGPDGAAHVPTVTAKGAAKVIVQPYGR